MIIEPSTKYMQFVILRSIRLSKLDLFAAILLFGFVLIYTSTWFEKEQVVLFSLRYADSLLLSLLLIAIANKFVKTEEKFESYFWGFLGLGYFVWFAFTLFRLFFWDQTSKANQSTISDLTYFAFYALAIAAIEIKSFSSAEKVLQKRSLVTSASILLFLIGSFTVLILLPANLGIQKDYWGSFFFYILMDSYLVLRWWHLALQSKEKTKLAFLFFSFASLVWVVADFLEYSILLEVDNLTQSWSDWFWYFPYMIFYLGIRLIEETNKKEPLVRYKRYHVLNSPLFFLGFVGVSFSINNYFNPPEDSATFQFVQGLWFFLTLLLGVFQTIELFERNKRRKKELVELQLKNDSISEKLDDVSRQMEKQITTNQLILDTISNPILTLELGGNIISCNLATLRLLGYSEREVVGRNITEFIPEDEELYRFFDYQSYRQQLLKSSNSFELESKVYSSSGDKVRFHVTISKSSEAFRDMIILSLTDIRKRIQAEEQIHLLKDEFTANVSHELRTPLTIVNGVIESLLKTNENSTTEKQLLIAKRNNLKLINMVDQLLDISKVASESFPISDIDVTSSISMICQSYSVIAADRNMDYSYSVCNPLLIKGNQQALEKILYNLISNAFKYTKEGGKIGVELIEQDDGYRLTVMDNGIGISKEELPKIFDRFQRSEFDNHHGIPGVGIGLSLVNDLTSSMNWQINVESEIGKGTQFSVFITKASDLSCQETPIKVTNASQTTLSLLDSQMTPLKEQSNELKSEHSVLIIEDNMEMQRYLESILQPHHQCLLASDGAKGIKLAEEYLPDIIISDVMMPNKDGFEVLSHLKNQSFTSHIPIIMLTAKADKKSKIKSLTSQADDYLTKPFDSDELILKVNNTLKLRKELQKKYESQWVEASKIQETADKIIDSPFLQSVNEIFEQNYSDQKFSTSQLAKRLAMSERQLQRKIKVLIDASPLDLLKKFRLEKSKTQLQQGVQVGLVAQSCGFSSQTYFGRCFKEEYGLTPKVFQKENH